MRPISNFVPVWEADGARHLHTTTARKRKRSLDEEHFDETEDSDSSNDNTFDFRRNVKSSQAKKDPYYVAGHDSSQPLPPPPYPHSAQNAVNTERPPKLGTISYDVAPQSLHQQHVAAITMVMHTSLLKGDYVRAGRAWGMLLRSSISGAPVNMRAHQRWTIGADILLHRDSNSKSTEVSQEALQAAKSYYEQLILQYPYQKHLRHLINSLSFYPAMFGLMIYEATEMSRRAISRIEGASAEPSSPNGSEGSDLSRKNEIADVKRSELESATHISAKLDELTLVPPFDYFKPLLQIRGMVALWIADLYQELSRAAHSDEQQADSSEQGLQSYANRQELERNAEKMKREREKARGLFRKVANDGGTLPDTVRHMLD